MKKKKDSKTVDPNDMTAWLSAIAAKINLPIEMLGEITTQMFFDIIRAYAGDDEDDEDRARKGTQEDIDTWLG